MVMPRWMYYWRPRAFAELVWARGLRFPLDIYIVASVLALGAILCGLVDKFGLYCLRHPGMVDPVAPAHNDSLSEFPPSSLYLNRTDYSVDLNYFVLKSLETRCSPFQLPTLGDGFGNKSAQFHQASAHLHDHCVSSKAHPLRSALLQPIRPVLLEARFSLDEPHLPGLCNASLLSHNGFGNNLANFNKHQSGLHQAMDIISRPSSTWTTPFQAVMSMTVKIISPYGAHVVDEQ